MVRLRKGIPAEQGGQPIARAYRSLSGVERLVCLRLIIAQNGRSAFEAEMAVGQSFNRAEGLAAAGLQWGDWHIDFVSIIIYAFSMENIPTTDQFPVAVFRIKNSRPRHLFWDKEFLFRVSPGSLAF